MRTSLNIPEEQLEQFDQIWRAQGISSRSRAVREAMLEYVESHQSVENMSGTVAAVIVFDYIFDAAIKDIYEIQHEYEHIVLASNHVHHGDWCLETIHCTGDAGDVGDFINRLRNFDDIRRVKLMVVEESSDDEHASHTH